MASTKAIAKRYPSDLTDEEWEVIKEVLEQEEPYTTGRPQTVDRREIVNALFYLNKTGCQWRYLPKDFPPYYTVSYYYHKWVRNGTLEKMNTEVRRRLRKNEGRNEDPSAAIIDTQSVKGTPESAIESGFDGGKRVKGRKRHIIVDTIGYLLVVIVHAANVFDGRGALQVVEKLFSIVTTVQLIWTDGTYKGHVITWALERFGCVLEMVKNKKKRKTKSGKGFKVLPRRWVVERTFAWLGRSRRLSKDYERNPSSSAGMVYVASIRLMLRRLTKPAEPIAQAA